MTEEISLEQLNARSILRGDQLRTMRDMKAQFTIGNIPFSQFKGQMSIGYGYMLTLPELKPTLENIIRAKNEENKEGEKFELTEIEPKSWNREDKGLDNKINLFIDTLSESLDNMRAKDTGK